MFTLSRRLDHLYRSCRDRDSRCNVVSRHRCSTQVCSTNFGSLQWYVKQIGSALTFLCCHVFCCRVNCYLAEIRIVSKWDGGQIQTKKTTAEGSVTNYDSPVTIVSYYVKNENLFHAQNYMNISISIERLFLTNVRSIQLINYK